MDRLVTVPGIDTLARTVESRWKKAGFKERAFPGIAAEALRAHRLSPRALVDAIARAPELPRQFSMESRFGQPPVTLFWSDRFFIDAYFWAEPATEIHSHSFRGAFSVVEGRSLEIRYRFTLRRRYGRNLFGGSLRPASAEILGPGDVRAIDAGPALVHRVIHLSHPTISIVVRTPRAESPLLSFLPPGMAATTPQHVSDTGKRKLALIGHLAAVRDRNLAATVERMMAHADDYIAFWYVVEYFRGTRDPRGARRLMKGRAWARPALQALQFECDRRVNWGAVDDEEERLIAAIGMSLGDAAVSRRLVARVAGRSSPGEFVSRAVRKLAGKGAINFDLNETAELVLRTLVDRLDPARALAREYDVPNRERLAFDIRRCRRSLEAHPLLRPFLVRIRRKLRDRPVIR